MSSTKQDHEILEAREYLEFDHQGLVHLLSELKPAVCVPLIEETGLFSERILTTKWNNSPYPEKVFRFLVIHSTSAGCDEVTQDDTHHSKLAQALDVCYLATQNGCFGIARWFTQVARLVRRLGSRVTS